MTLITGAENIEMARLIALRGALSLECRGLGRRGRSANTIATDFLKAEGIVAQNKRPNKATTYALLNKWLVDHGAQDRPLVL